MTQEIPKNPERKAILVGATSAIAQALAEKLVEQNWGIVLTGRNLDRTEAVAQHLRIKFERGTNHVQAVVGSPTEIWEAHRHNCQLVVIAAGYLPEDPEKTTHEETQTTFQANTLLPIEWCQLAADRETGMTFGTICVVGSVAGDRGRASNHIYGAAKAAVETYCLGLAHRLALRRKEQFRPWSGPQICLVKPGFTRSPMTANLPDSPLMASPETTAASILTAIKRKKTVAYCPGFWRLIMLVVKLLPKKILWKTKL